MSSTKRINTKESVIDMTDYIDKQIRVRFVGGKQVVGILKGADPICNLVLDEATEIMPQIDYTKPCETRHLGIMIARGTAVLAICKADGFEEIENPYAADTI